MFSKLKNLQTFTALILSVLPVLSIGATYGWGPNHSTYLIEGLKMAHPEIWQNDWWVNETTHYHFLFSYFVLALEKMGVLLPGIILANILVIFASFSLVYKIIQEVAAKRSLEIFTAIVLLFVFLHQTKSIALTFFFIESFQPSSFGTLGYLLGMYLFLRGRYLQSGLSVGIFSLFHANFLLLAFPLFGLAHILIREEDFLKRCLLQFSPLVIAFLLLLPSILATVDLGASKESTAEALNIIFTIRSPWHYDFSYFRGQLIPFFGWLSMGFASAYICLETSAGTRRYIALYVAMCLILAATALEAISINSDFFTRLFVWRLAPFALLFAMILLIAGTLKDFWLKQSKGNAALWYFALFVLGAALLILAEATLFINFPDKRPLVFLIVPLSLAALWIYNIFRSLNKRHAPSDNTFLTFWGALVLGLPVGLMLFQGPAPVNSCRFAYLDETCWVNETELFKFVQTSTEKEAVFITPPDLAVFRLFTQRAVVASSNEVPFTPNETLEWYRRMSDIVGLEKIKDWRKIKVTYQNQSPEHLEYLREKYRVDYAVYRKNVDFNPALSERFGPPVFENEEYYLFSLKQKEAGR